MKLSKRTIVIVVLLAAVLLIAGYFAWSSVFNWILPVTKGISYTSARLTDLAPSLVFAISLALIPVATILVWKFGSIANRQRRLFTIFVIIAMMIGSLVIRREMIKSSAEKLQPVITTDYSDPNNPVQREIKMGLRISDLQFEKFILIGLIAGTIISFFALRQRSKKDGSPEDG